MVVEIGIKSEFTTMDIVSYVSKLKGSPWHSERRKAGGFRLYHKTTEKQGREGNIRLRRTEKTKDGLRRIYATAVGADEVKLTSEFVEWLLTHFRNKCVKITIK